MAGGNMNTHETSKETTAVIELLQSTLAGKIDPSSNFNPQFLAEAIVEKLNFNLSPIERNAKKVEDAIRSFEKMISDIDEDMDNELQQLGKDELLVKNFVRGQKTACEKLKESLKEI